MCNKIQKKHKFYSSTWNNCWTLYESKICLANVLKARIVCKVLYSYIVFHFLILLATNVTLCCQSTLNYVLVLYLCKIQLQIVLRQFCVVWVHVASLCKVLNPYLHRPTRCIKRCLCLHSSCPRWRVPFAVTLLYLSFL